MKGSKKWLWTCWRSSTGVSWAELQLPGNLGHLKHKLLVAPRCESPAGPMEPPGPTCSGWAGAALHGLPREPGGTGKEMKIQVQPWEHSFWGLVFSNCHTLTLPHNLLDESTKSQSWACALCWHTVGVFIILIFWKKISFSPEKVPTWNADFNHLYFLSDVLSWHCCAIWSHLEEKNLLPESVDLELY